MSFNVPDSAIAYNGRIAIGLRLVAFFQGNPSIHCCQPCLAKQLGLTRSVVWAAVLYITSGKGTLKFRLVLRRGECAVCKKSPMTIVSLPLSEVSSSSEARPSH